MFKLVKSKEELRSFEISILSKANDPGNVRVTSRPNRFPCLVAGVLSHRKQHPDRRPRPRDANDLRGRGQIGYIDEGPRERPMIWSPVLTLISIQRNQARKLVYHRTLTDYRKRLAEIVTSKEEFDAVARRIMAANGQTRTGSPIFDKETARLFGEVQSQLNTTFATKVAFPVILKTSSASREDREGIITVYPTMVFLTMKQARSLVYFKKARKPSPADMIMERLDKRKKTSLGDLVHSVTEDIGSQQMRKPPRRKSLRRSPW